MDNEFATITSGADIARLTKKYTVASWTAQDQWNPLSMTKAEGVYFWNADGKKFIDWSSQLMNMNIGHGNKYVNEAIKKEVDKISFGYPGIATESRGKLGEMLNDITPDHISKSFFTNGGADAVENAIKMARLFTGRNKIMTRYRAYHGGTFGAMTAGGDPRRLANEPGIPGIVRMQDPYACTPLMVCQIYCEKCADILMSNILNPPLQQPGQSVPHP